MLSAQQVLDRNFLEIRANLIVVAAALDRIDRAAGADRVRADPRVTGIGKALKALMEGAPNRAESVQMVFSEGYDPNWARPRAGSR